jgi:hypothetical protein
MAAVASAVILAHPAVFSVPVWLKNKNKNRINW